MLKGLRLKIMVIAGFMLAFLWYSSFDEARGQVCDPEDAPCMCPLSTDKTGWFQLNVSFFFDIFGTELISDFTSGLFGTVESGGPGQPNFGGLDWLFNNDSHLNTNLPGSQLITWYSQANGRNSFIQVTNTLGSETPEPGEQTCFGFCSNDNDQVCSSNADCPDTDGIQGTCIFGVEVHVQIFDSGCAELINFCDFYTCNDTHVYDLGNLVKNSPFGANVTDVPDGTEGFFVATAVDDCEDTDDREAICYNFLDGNLRMIGLEGSDIDYGTNVDAREAVFIKTEETCSGEDDSDLFTDLDGKNQELAHKIPGDDGDPDLYHMFSTIGVAPASDLVLISVNDSYPAPYTIFPGFAIYSPTIYDAEESGISCTPFFACFARFGINSALPNSNDFAPPTPTPTPTTAPSPTPTPTTAPSGGGGGCAIAGVSPVQLGTAMANVLIPLIPAFAIGYRILRRRARRNEK